MTAGKAIGGDRVMGLCDPDVFGDEEQRWGLEKELDWRIAWQRAVAKAWAVPEYRQRLLEQPAMALREVGWVLPEGLELRVEPAGEGAKWDAGVHESPELAGATRHLVANGWAAEVERTAGSPVLRDRRIEALKALKTTVVLRLPPAPEREQLAPLALADYDGLSRAYPFTCSCGC